MIMKEISVKSKFCLTNLDRIESHSCGGFQKIFGNFYTKFFPSSE